MILKDEKVKIDTLKYYITALRAKYWITNSSVLRGLNFKKKQTKYIIFQHGTLGIKKLGIDLKKDNKSFRMKRKEPIDLFIIQGKKEKEKLKEKIINNINNNLTKNYDKDKYELSNIVEEMEKIYNEMQK